nr:MAG TPA: hypothetical protein [Caudoviricetes sp.]
MGNAEFLYKRNSRSENHSCNLIYLFRFSIISL